VPDDGARITPGRIAAAAKQTSGCPSCVARQRQPAGGARAPTGSPAARNSQTAATSRNVRPCDAATPACVTYPLYVFTPFFSAA
jgi:hypothetical protein